MTQEPSTGRVQQAKDANPITDQLRERSTEVLQQAQETASNTVSQQKGRAAESLSTLAQAFRQTGQHLYEQDQGTFGRMADQAAERLDRFSDDLQNKSVDEILGQVEDFARRDPQLFLGGALVLGLLGARFLKSSASRQQPRQGDMGRYYQSAPGSRYGGQGRATYREGAFGGDEYTGTYMPDYYTAGTSSETTSTSQESTRFPPSYPPTGNPEDRPYSGTTRGTDE